ncbi:His-Xaa-Ser system protein HxsD [Candidatus Gracilibacteria bacterium CG_4_9_14_0_2_um_filter_38_7]|nr:MAG: His-Xaa-Ser system protein HxsD [Candidatus Gracilibacteria bacterium CG1_02_38_174]PIQ11779.1 MAG: His-Xaa-Ser system protein HxsD [Candidatus Gracilibacteria bacterium CG18_big_fil_WC_8_21_14_2_50_38_16]PIQ41396.1 MAG: His-Xaa-Ser system protein HxsD [Candidatus Gracilibacteria bacterium CG12_big_fil_rev_8_21_14_0_65_38_15]PIZ01413.1 MAG: His-Xaa-Ser system protein HxsD [Candidatus Gracilibacteria bacterium CG_4_10_14_0_8_um_filter_38_28]PJC56597.1 MAG: His-Xaa-Ser system protein HxsD
MIEFLKKDIENNRFELTIDTGLFSSDIVLKAAYNFLDRGYFFFELDGKKSITLQFTPKEGVKDSPETLIGKFSDELLSVVLRDKLEKDNKDIREKIIGAAIANSLDSKGFVELDTDRKQDNMQGNQIDFDKDIDEILREIENDPELKIDEAEIERILKEIEEETQSELSVKKTTVTLDVNAVKNAKKKFGNK